MGVNVFANGREISCKSGSGNVSGATPDVCLSPPAPPAGPVPLPYVLASFDSDTTDGSKTVQISGKEVMLKDKSKFKKCTGDEAATKAQGMGVVSHNITGPVYFISWSDDVEIEGENVVRHLDMVTSNHGSLENEAAPSPDKISAAGTDDCEEAKEVVKDGRNDLEQEKFKKEDEDAPTHVFTGAVLRVPGQAAMQILSSSNLASMIALTAKAMGQAATMALAATIPVFSKVSAAGRVMSLGNTTTNESQVVGKNGTKFNYFPCKDGKGEKQPRPGCKNGPLSHTESRMIEDIFTKFPGGPPPGTRLTMRVRWLTKGSPPQMWGAPCPGCKALIEFVNANTDLQITVCDENGDSVTPETKTPPDWKCE